MHGSQQFCTYSTQPVASAVKPSAAPAAYLQPVVTHTPLIPDMEQKLAPPKNIPSSTKNFWLEKSKETVTQGQTEAQTIHHVPPEKPSTEKPKPTTLPKPKGI